MYRRLKNLLGVSLILLSLLVSQIPMPEVVADEPVAGADEPVVTAEMISEDVDEVTNDETAHVDSVTDENTGVAVIDDTGSTTTDTTNGTDTSTGTTTDTTILATPTSVTVTFDYRADGITNDTLTVDVSDGIAKTITAPTKYVIDQQETFGNVAMIFKGWFKDPDNGEAWDFSTMTVLSQDITLYAQWVRNDDAVARITYSATEADLNAEKYADVKLGECIPKPKDIPVRDGYEVDYWVIEGQTTEVNWEQAVTGNLTLVAVWKAKTYTLTLDLNGAKLAQDFTYNTVTYPQDSEKLELAIGYGIVFGDISFTSDYVVYHGETLDDKWYMDSYALAEYNQTAQIKRSTTLYKRVVDKETKDSTGFEMNIDGTVLYHYEHLDGASDDVVIPATVKVIGVGAFDNLNGIRSVTLPAGIEDIRAGAFSGAESLVNTMTVYASGTTESMSKGMELAKQYEYIEYQESSTTEATTAKLDAVNCGLYESNSATGEGLYPTYVSFLLPVGIEKGSYSVSIEPNDSPIKLDDLLAAIGITDTKRLYHMEINLQKDGKAYSNYNKDRTFTVILPMPQNWQGIDLEGNTTVYTVSQDGTKLETLAATIVVKDGIKCVKFEPYHFSEFAVYYGGTMEIPDSNAGSGGGNTGTGGNTGSNTGNGNTNSGGTSSGGSTSGGTSSGGSNSGNSNSNNNNSGSGNSGSSSTGNNTGSSNQGNGGGSGSVTQAAPGSSTATTPGVGTTMNLGTAGQGQGAGHIKDATPKTGDPLEYRTMAVCILFSVGVIILLIGNEKKERVSRASRVLRG